MLALAADTAAHVVRRVNQTHVVVYAGVSGALGSTGAC